MQARHTLARRVFLTAGIYGLVVLLPQYFMEGTLGRNFPPSLTHPENFYGFIGIGLAWQFAFLLIARDVQRFRLFMLPAVLEKLSFGIAVLVLYGQGRIPPLVACAGSIDLLFAAFFAQAFRSTSRVEDLRERDAGQLFNFSLASTDSKKGHQNTMKEKISQLETTD